MKPNPDSRLTRHAAERLLSRFPFDEARTLAVRADKYARLCKYGRWAVLLARLDTMRGEAWSDDSNGSRVVAIIEDGRVATVEYRRATQPWSRGSLRVDYLLIAEEA